MKKAETLPAIANELEWQIDRRRRIQTLLCRMYHFLDEYTEFHKTDDDCWHAMNRMTVAGFSLWRSAFLTKASGERKDLYDKTKTFLHRILTHNAIAFADDYANSELSVVYYNNNARYRLERMYAHNQSLYQTPNSFHVEALRAKETGDLEKIKQTEVWDKLYLALLECFDAFEKDWAKRWRPKPAASKGARKKPDKQKKKKKRL